MRGIHRWPVNCPHGKWIPPWIWIFHFVTTPWHKYAFLNRDQYIKTTSQGSYRLRKFSCLFNSLLSKKIIAPHYGPFIRRMHRWPFKRDCRVHQITGYSVACSTACPIQQQIKYQSSTLLGWLGCFHNKVSVLRNGLSYYDVFVVANVSIYLSRLVI